MKKFFSLVALVALLLFLPVVVWGVKGMQLEQTLVLDNRDEDVPPNTGSKYFFQNAKTETTHEALQNAEFSIDEAKAFDSIFVSSEDGVAISSDQWNQVKMNIDQNGPSLLFAEYGVIHNTESGELSKLISQDLGVSSTNWSGLFVPELSDRSNATIPEKVFSNVEGEWNYSGPGLVLNNSNEEKAIVVELTGHDANERLRLVATEAGQKQGFKDLPVAYTGWFDIVEPVGETETLLEFALDLTDENKKMFRDNGIPEAIPAVTFYRDGKSNRFYLAGRFSDSHAIPEIFQVQGIQHIYGAIERFSSNRFYWNSFFPLMTKSLNMHQELSGDLDEDIAVEAERPIEQANYPSRVGTSNDRIEVKVGDKFVPITIKGVNIGMAKPGYFPGEAAITQEEYDAWFEQIGAMNANTVRVYTLHPPEFYRALDKYNSTHEQKIYVLHGVWINEEWITGDADAFHKEAVDGFQREIGHVVDALHGNALVEAVPGHSSGVYVTDVSDYVIGWVIGTEWDPFMVQGTNEKHSSIGQFDGEYYRTKDASPFEYWLASQMEFTTKYEAGKYNEVRPMSFTNWVTTDILDHPSDDSDQEDVSEVDPNHIYTKGIMEEVGQFASYHIYPYYPDFLQHDQKYLNTTDFRGEQNTYFAYLTELRAVHNMPVLVAEFGIPSSRGRTHTGPQGMHQGMVSEKDQGIYVQKMFEDILAADYMGGLVFTWQDEWFKRTWNTMDFDNPDRRPFWSNAQTSEQQFGLLSYDTLKMKVDGDGGEWTVEPFYTAAADTDPIRKAFVDHDERYLYFKIDFGEPVAEGNYPLVLIDSIQEQGNNLINQLNVTSETAADYMISFEHDNARVAVDPYYDIHNYLYGFVYGFISGTHNPEQRNSGDFVPIKYVLNQTMFNPETGETIPFEEYEAGKLVEGNGNPESPDYNSLADFAWSNDHTVLEARIPWLLLNFRDPSRKEITADFVKSGSIYDSERIDDIGIGFVYTDGAQPVQTLPAMKDEVPELVPLGRYSWENWDYIETTPRPKQSYFHLKEYFASVE